MSSLVADTHAVVWFLSGDTQISATARSAMEAALEAGDPIFVATISLVEIAYLIEKGRIAPSIYPLMDAALTDPDSGFVPAPLDTEVARTLRYVSRDLIPDMPDRIVAATARHLGLAVVTADRKIRSSGITTIW